MLRHQRFFVPDTTGCRRSDAGDKRHGADSRRYGVGYRRLEAVSQSNTLNAYPCDCSHSMERGRA